MQPRHSIFGLGLSLVTLTIWACATQNADDQSVHCTPGNYVFCKCEDRTDGTKLCRTNGSSFDECKCEGSSDSPSGGDYDGSLGDSSLETVDGGKTEGLAIDTRCVGKLGIVAGSLDNLDAYVASYVAAGTFSVSKSTGPALRGPAVLQPVGSSLVATYPSRYNLLVWTKMASAAWAAPNSIGDAVASGTVSATMLGGQLRLFYLGQDKHMHVGTYGEATGWDDATALAEPAGDAGAALGKSSPSGATVGSSMTLAYAADDGALWREGYASGVWSSAKIAGPSTFQSAPAITALESGGPSDLLLAYTGSDLLVHAVARDATTKNWGSAMLVDTAASATEISLTGLRGGNALLVYRASNQQGYYSVWSPGTNFQAPAELVPGKNPELASVPSVTRGTCGSDATIAYAQSDGLVKIVRFSDGSMSAPFDVGGIPKATFVGVGELP